MPATNVRGGQIRDGTVQRVDLDVGTPGQSVIARLLQGGGIKITGTGADAGTGDVTVDLDVKYDGDYAAGAFNDGDIVIQNGVAYLCVRPTSNPPVAWDGGVSGGSGLPVGGTVGQALKKNSGTNYDSSWGNLSDLVDTPWVDYTPTLTPYAGTFTSATATGRYKQIGKIVFLHVTVNITTNGTAATNVGVSLPITANSTNFTGSGRENLATGKALTGVLSSTTQMWIQNYDNSYPGGNGYRLNVDMVYESV